MHTDDKLFEDMTGISQPAPMDRRGFLARAGGGIFILFTLGDSLEAMQRRTLPDDFNAFLRIGEDGRVQCLTGKIEMGQGVVTSLGMMLADELDVELEKVDMVMGDTDIVPYDRGTWGSLSTRQFGPSLRAAGAEGRQAIKELAAEKLGISIGRIGTENGIAFDKENRSKSVSYADLVKGSRIERKASGTIAVKKPSEFRIMGTSVPRRDANEKVTGAAKYAGDIQLPGMLYASILRGPALDSKLTSVDTSAAERMEGVRVVRDGDLIAVLHASPDGAAEALGKVRATWDTPATTLNEDTIYDHLRSKGDAGRETESRGDLKAGKAASTKLLESTFYNAYVAHAPMEPHTSVAHVDGDKVTVWASTQSPFGSQGSVARALGIDEKQVRVITPFVGGGFGGKGTDVQSGEAARISKLSGTPVQVQWSRKEEFLFDTFRPACVINVTSGIDDKGKATLWDYTVHFAGGRGSESIYDFPHMKVAASPSSRSDAHPVRTGAWRAPGANNNGFARESHIDIMAAAAGMDPYEFRMKNLSDQNYIRVLKAAAEKFGYTPAKGPSGRGIGMALGFDAGTYVASFAQVDVNRKTGEVKVGRVVCAQDMGLCVNPRGATLQMEGCIMMGLGYALTEEVSFRGGQVLNENFDSYELPRFSWLPKIESVIVENQDAAPQGGGEPAIILMGAVVANAIYDATGARLYHMPMTPKRVLEALKQI